MGAEPLEIASYMFSEALDEEIFFFLYNMGRSEYETLSYPVYKRKWIIHRFIEQKRKENDEIEKARKKK